MKEALEKAVRALRLAAAKGAARAEVALEDLMERTREQLLEAARTLELRSVSKLRKEDLARRVLQALHVVSAPEAKSAQGAKPTPEAKSAQGAKPAPEAKSAQGAKSAPEAPARAPARAAAEKAPPPAPAAPATETPEAEEAPRPDPAATAKLDLGPEARLEKLPKDIPWSYGLDRVTAAAVDPDRMYVYWEVTDSALERAREALGPGGSGAWIDLRVYDTSGRLFDGTNAHGYFDHRVERSDRQWFFTIGKPTSTAVVEIGMKSPEGYFVRIARSGRVDFPRREPAPWHEPEWMTVLATGETRDAGRGAPRGAPAPAPAPQPAGAAAPIAPGGFTPFPLWVVREWQEAREVHRQLLDAGWERVEWTSASGETWFEMRGRSEWYEPALVTSWEAGPFAYPVQIEPPKSEAWEGPTLVYRVGDVTHVVSGPWQVVIRNLGAHSNRAVVGRWEMYRWWVAEAGRETRTAAAAQVSTPGASEQGARAGASERRWLAASELRLGGASELWRLGASELRFRGASERLYAGASEWAVRGASETRYAGASELRLRGASERRLGGASEARLGGASERQVPDGEPGAAPPAYPSPDDVFPAASE